MESRITQVVTTVIASAPEYVQCSALQRKIPCPDAESLLLPPSKRVQFPFSLLNIACTSISSPSPSSTIASGAHAISQPTSTSISSPSSTTVVTVVVPAISQTTTLYSKFRLV